MTEEQYLHQQIKMLRLQYEASAKPYLDRLYAIKALNPTPRMVLDLASGNLSLLSDADVAELSSVWPAGSDEIKKPT